MVEKASRNESSQRGPFCPPSHECDLCGEGVSQVPASAGVQEWDATLSAALVLIDFKSRDLPSHLSEAGIALQGCLVGSPV